MTTLAALVLIAAQAAAATQAAPPSDAPPIRNFVRVSTDFCTGGQPQMEHIARLKADGVRAIVNLRTPGEHEAEVERRTVEEAGLKYFNIPVVFRKPSAAQVDEFLRITDDPANRPMFIHCTAAVRVGAFWMIRRVLRDGWTWDRALDEARTIGLVKAPHLETFAKEYIAAHQAR